MGGISTWSFVLVTGVALAVNGEAPAIEASENGVTITVDAGQDVTVRFLPTLHSFPSRWAVCCAATNAP